MGVEAPVDPRSILSLDTSIAIVGWAHWAKDTERSTSGSFALGDLGGSPAYRIDQYLRWLTRKIETDHPDLILIEEPFSGRAGDNPGTTHALSALYMMTLVVGLRLGIHVRSLSRGEVAKSVLGWALRPRDPHWVKTKGRRPKMRGPRKPEITAAINARHGLRLTCHDEADARAGLDMILAELAGTGMPQTVKIPDTMSISAPSQAGEKIDTPPARQQLHAAQAAIPLDQIQAPARRQLERALADMGIGDPRLPRPVRKARGRRRATV